MHTKKPRGCDLISRTFLLFLLLGSINKICAQSTEKNTPYDLIVMLSTGPSFSNNKSTETLYLQPDLQNTYKGTRKSQVLIDGEIFLGIQQTLNNKLSGQIGLAYAAMNSAQLNGNIWNDADPNFNNFNYRYNINNRHIAIKGTLFANTLIWESIPYLSASLGVAFNRANNFTMTPKLYEQLPPPGFLPNTTTSIAYTLGAGLQKTLNKHWQVGMGYAFFDWGQNQLASAPGQTLNSGIGASHFYTNSIQFNLSYTV